jgi:rubrerythrin
MDEQDRLAEIKATEEDRQRRYDLRNETIVWLVGEVEGLREDRTRLKAYFDHVEADRDRLRELLGRLEWVEQGYNCVDFDEICPVCQADKDAPHRDDCWLGKELGR